MKDYMEWIKDMIASGSDGGPPRWFSPLECAAPMKDSPLLLYLPGDLIGTATLLIFYIYSMNGQYSRKSHL